MDVYDAVASRRSVRAFSDRPVPPETLRRVLEAARRAPSSGNLQPWRLYVVAGQPLTELKRRATARAEAGDPGDDRQYPMYPEPMAPHHEQRFVDAAVVRYASLGIDRDDPQRPSKLAALNVSAFGAPVVLFCYVDAEVGPGQWADAGMLLQTVMLLLRAEGLHSCPQVMWTTYRTEVDATVRPPEGAVLLCGMSVGFEQDGAPPALTERAPMEETVRFIGVGTEV